MKDVQKWLRQSPKKSEIVEIQNGKDKVKIIPQKIIESLLDELTENYGWSTEKFQFSRFSEYDANGKWVRTLCDASLELVVTYRLMVVGPLNQNTPVLIEKEITRRLVGAVTFDVSFFGNDHTANTAKSLATTNAATDLGNRFGKSLNPKEASMMILGMKQPLQIPAGQVTDEARNKISESLDKIKGDLKNKMIG